MKATGSILILSPEFVKLPIMQDFVPSQFSPLNEAFLGIFSGTEDSRTTC